MNEIEYYTDLIQKFPSLSEIIVLEEGNTFSNMEEFADYTNTQIKHNNTDELNRCFEFQEERIELVNELLENALNVSYCEALLLGSNSSNMDEIVKLMPPKVRKVYKDYEEYYYNLGKKNTNS